MSLRAGGWRTGLGPGPEEGVVQYARDLTSTLRRFLWLLGGEETAGGKLEGVSCFQAVAESG